MRKLLFGILLFCCIYGIKAQNVGVGTTSPGHKLTIEQKGGGKYNQGFEWTGSAFAIRSGTNIGSDYSLVVGVDTLNKVSYIQSYIQGLGARNLVLNGIGGNVGIGTASPNAALQFANIAASRKIVLYEAGNNDHQFSGFGLENAFIRYQLANTSGDHVFFAAASASASNELMRIKGNGNVGIGNNNPDAPLSFSATLGKKITFYPGTLGNAGIGMAANRLKIYADNPNADVAIGYDVAGTFNEKFAVKPNGALAVNGNMGSAGQVLTSNGSGVPATWTNPSATTNIGTYNFATQSASSADLIDNSSLVEIDVPGMVANFTLNTSATVVFNYRVRITNRGCFGCGERLTFIGLEQNISGGTTSTHNTTVYTPNEKFADGVSGPFYLNLGPGTYSFKITIIKSVYGSATVYVVNSNYNILSWQIFPQ